LFPDVSHVEFTYFAARFVAFVRPGHEGITRCLCSRRGQSRAALTRFPFRLRGVCSSKNLKIFHYRKITQESELFTETAVSKIILSSCDPRTTSIATISDPARGLSIARVSLREADGRSKDEVDSWQGLAYIRQDCLSRGSR